MELLARSLPSLKRRHLVTIGSVIMSCGLTAVMSLLFHGTVMPDMLITGFVCAVVIDRIINRISGTYRRKLADANRELERRVRERTADLERANEELLVRDRMATAGMLAAGVSHEIKSPLSVIRIAADELSELVACSDQRAMACDIAEAAMRIDTILRDLNSLARPVEDPITPTELAPVVETASRLASYKLAKGTGLINKLRDAPAVLGNSARLVQLLLNLIVNAARAS